MKIDLNGRYYILLDTRTDDIITVKNKSMFGAHANAILSLYNSSIWFDVKCHWLADKLGISASIAKEACQMYELYKLHLRQNRIDVNLKYGQHIQMYVDNENVFSQYTNLKFSDQKIIVKKFVDSIVLGD